MIRIVMEMDTAVPVNVNAYLIMNMNKIAHIMDVSTFNSLVLILLICNLFKIWLKESAATRETSLGRSRPLHGASFQIARFSSLLW